MNIALFVIAVNCLYIQFSATQRLKAHITGWQVFSKILLTTAFVSASLISDGQVIWAGMLWVYLALELALDAKYPLELRRKESVAAFTRKHGFSPVA